MGTHHGKNGVVKVGANAVAEVQNFSVTEQVSTADDTAMGDADETHLVGIKSWNGNLSCSWDETDATGQEALTVGASVNLGLYPEGSGSGASYLSGTATVTQITLDVKRDGVVTRAFDFKGNGALAHSNL